MQYKGVFASSSDETGQTLSTTVNGVVVVLSAVVPMLALNFLHVQVTAGDVSALVTEGTTLVGTIMAIRGIILKVIHSYGTIKQDPSVVPQTAPLG
jgi:hypothetical protein